MQANTEKTLLAPKPIGEWPDTILFRPVAALVARVLAPTRVTANQVSVWAGIAGILAGAALVWPGGGSLGRVLAAIGFLLYLVLDCADGQLARLRGPTGSLGAIIDGVSDYVSAVALHVGLLVQLLRESGNAWISVLVVVFSGASMAWHAAVFDDRKNRHLEKVKEGYTRFNTTPEKLGKEIEASTSAWERMLLGLLVRYLAVHGRMEGEKRELSPFSRDEAESYDRRRRPWVNALSVIGPTHHFFIAVLVLVAACAVPHALWGYVAYALACNAYLLALLAIDPDRCGTRS